MKESWFIWKLKPVDIWKLWKLRWNIGSIHLLGDFPYKNSCLYYSWFLLSVSEKDARYIQEVYKTHDCVLAKNCLQGNQEWVSDLFGF